VQAWSGSGSWTLSIGVVPMVAAIRWRRRLIKNAGGAVRDAKEAGKNCRSTGVVAISKCASGSNGQVSGTELRCYE